MDDTRVNYHIMLFTNPQFRLTTKISSEYLGHQNSMMMPDVAVTLSLRLSVLKPKKRTLSLNAAP